MSRKKFDIIEFILLFGIIVFLNIIFGKYFFRIDLTEDKRYTISPSTKKAVEEINDVLFVEVFLSGELTPDYERLRKSIAEKLNEIVLYSKGKVVYKFTDPNAIEDKRLREQFFSQLVQKGVQYKYERLDENGKVEEKIIFPSALVSYHGKEAPVMFLKGSKIAPLPEQLNQSVEGVEYELLAALRKLNSKTEKSLAFIEGHGEFESNNVADISAALSEYYNVERVTLNDSVNLQAYQALVLAGPVKPFTEKEKYHLDQYVVNGGNLLILADALNLNPDSLMNGYTYAFSYETGLDDLFFKFGVRLNKNLVQDVNSALIRVATGNGSQTEVVNWPYHPIIYNYGNHPVVKNLDALVLKYAGTIDTVKATGILKQPLLFTTENTRIINAPAQLDLNETRKTADPASYNAGKHCVAYLLEGKFQSMFRLKPSPVTGKKVTIENKYSKIIICSDADLIKNEIDKLKKKPLPLGYDPNIQYEFSNKEFLQNSIDYLMGEDIVNIRGKEIKLRPLDKIKIAEGKLKWQIINLVTPAMVIIIFGFIRNAMRVRKYTSQK